MHHLLRESVDSYEAQLAAQTFFNDDDDGGKYNLSERELAECSFYKKGHTKVNISLKTTRTKVSLRAKY